MSPEERLQQAISILNEHYGDIIKDVKFSWTLNFTKELRVAFTFSNGVQKNLCFSSIWYDSDRLEDLVGLKHLSFQGWENEDIKIITKFVHYLTYLAKEDGAL